MTGLGNILGAGVGIFQDWLQGKRLRQQARLEADIEIERRRATADIEWDNIQASNSAVTWADELLTVALLLPIAAAFIPGLQSYVSEGFQILEEDVPGWFLAAWMVSVSAAFGYRKLAAPFIERMRR
jgi:hypothetical protein